MKKLLFAAYSLDVGGIEKALLTLVNYLQHKGYEITVALEKKQGIFLSDLDKKINVIEYRPDNSRNIIIRKIKNLIKRLKFIVKYKNKFDFSASFATYSIASSFMSRTASKNTCLWGHADYFTLFEKNEEKMKEFFKKIKYNKFKHIIFVSDEGKNTFIKVFPEMEKRTFTCNNLIDGKKIIELSKEKIELKKENIPTFINVGRHEERQKRLSRIIEAANILKKKNYKFRILLIGDGPDEKKYKEEVKQKKLQDILIFLGRQQNPYPYFNIADCVILSSEYEGYPVVFLESFILNKPLITTKVSDYEEVEGKYGYVAEKTTEDICNKMKKFLETGFEIKEKFDYEKYNEKILEKINNIIERKEQDA